MTERYCLYTVRHGKTYRIQIHHPPWELQLAEAEFEINTMATSQGISLPKEPPMLHFSKVQEVYIFPQEEIGRDRLTGVFDS